MIPSHVEDRLPGGFTLIEVMVALLAASIILVGVYGSLSRTLISRDVAEGRAELFATGRDTVMRMADEIGAALRPPAGVLVGMAKGGRVPRDSIAFYKVNRGGYGQGRVRPGVVTVSYYLDPIPRKPNYFTLWRTEELPPPPVPAGQTAPASTPVPSGTPQGPVRADIPLLTCEDVPGQVDIPGSCTRVVGLRFSYLDGEVSDWREEWDTYANPQKPRIPIAVEIDLFLEDDRGAFHEFKTVVDLPLARPTPTP